MAGLLALGLAAQVMFAGAAVFVDGAWWGVHLAAIHWVDWITVVLVVLGFAGGMSRRFKVLSVVVILLVLAQYVTAGWHGSATFGWGAAVHPLTRFLMFWAAAGGLGRAISVKRARTVVGNRLHRKTRGLSPPDPQGAEAPETARSRWTTGATPARQQDQTASGRPSRAPAPRPNRQGE